MSFKHYGAAIAALASATCGPASAKVIWSEDFETLAPSLGPFVSATESGGDGTDWTGTPPPGWSKDTGGTPVGGPVEFFGWTFLDAASWAATSGGQLREDFTGGSGVIMVADPDEYDDGTNVDPDLYEAAITTPDINVSGVTNLVLGFASSWRPEDNQKAALEISVDGGSKVEVFRWTSDINDPDFKPDSVDELLSIDLGSLVPQGASTVAFSFRLFDAGNDWWWAVDTIELSGDPIPLPAALPLFAAGLLGAGALGRRGRAPRA